MTWTKFSERLPEDSVEAVHVINSVGRLVLWTRNNTRDGSWKDYANEPLFWHPITYPELPKREPTQRDIDNSKCEQSWMEIGAGSSLPEFRRGFYAALIYERAEVAKLLNDVAGGTGILPTVRAMTELRKRVGIDK